MTKRDVGLEVFSATMTAALAADSTPTRAGTPTTCSPRTPSRHGEFRTPPRSISAPRIVGTTAYHLDLAGNCPARTAPACAPDPHLPGHLSNLHGARLPVARCVPRPACPLMRNPLHDAPFPGGQWLRFRETTCRSTGRPRRPPRRSDVRSYALAAAHPLRMRGKGRSAPGTGMPAYDPNLPSTIDARTRTGSVTLRAKCKRRQNRPPDPRRDVVMTVQGVDHTNLRDQGRDTPQLLEDQCNYELTEDHRRDRPMQQLRYDTSAGAVVSDDHSQTRCKLYLLTRRRLS